MSAISQQDWQDQELGRAVRELDEATDKAMVLWSLTRLDERTCRINLYSSTRFLYAVDGPSFESVIRDAIRLLM